MTSPVFIGIDIGGTKVLAGEVDHDGRVLRTARRETPGRRVPAALVEAALTEAVDEVADGRPVRAVGLAAAGFVDSTRTRVLFAPHLPWHGEDVVARLSAAWRVPVIMDNDANCTALAETAYGAARDASSTVLVTLGTGIGGRGRARRGPVARRRRHGRGVRPPAAGARAGCRASADGPAAGSSTAAATRCCATRAPDWPPRRCSNGRAAATQAR